MSSTKIRSHTSEAGKRAFIGQIPHKHSAIRELHHLHFPISCPIANVITRLSMKLLPRAGSSTAGVTGQVCQSLRYFLPQDVGQNLLASYELRILRWFIKSSHTMTSFNSQCDSNVLCQSDSIAFLLSYLIAFNCRY